MTFDEFNRDIEDGIKEYPPNWRYGQKVFNYVDEKYGVARKVQYLDNVDCFYNDGFVQSFIICAYRRLVKI